MTFNNIFSLKGQFLTYRDFWALTLGSYAGAVIVTGAILSLVCSKYGESKPYWKATLASWKYKAIAGSIAGGYIFIMFILALVNGLFVFGGESILLYLGVLLAVQVIFTLVGIFVRFPHLTTCLISMSNWCIAGSIYFLIQLPSMFDLMPHDLVWLVAIAASIPLALKAGITYMRLSSVSQTLGFREKLHLSLRKISFYAAMAAAMMCGIVIVFFLAGTCITVYGPNVDGSWVTFASTLRWNSRMMRSYAPDPCPAPGPCHVYLTAGSDLTSEVFVNVHMPADSTKFLTINVNDGQVVVNATEFDTPLLDKHDQRLVYSAYISGLTPGANHSFTITADSGVVGESSYEFRTAPASDADFNFVVAGDAGTSDFTDAVMTQMIATSPYLAVIGGDVAYDNGFMSCACVWDKYLSMWEAKRVEGRYLVPMSFAAGNHDLAVNDNSDGAFDKQQYECNPEDISYAKPVFFSWFPHEVTLGGEPKPVCARSTLKLHTIAGRMNVWVLDSAYAVTPQANIDFVDSLITNSSEVQNVAVYHVPLYSSNPDDVDKGRYLEAAWVPGIFDKYNFAACFENHAHTYKRTKKMLNGTAVGDDGLGTVFLGDGKMGISGMAVPDASKVVPVTDNGVFAKTGAQYHFFAVNLNYGSGQLTVDVISHNGTQFDGWHSAGGP